jgi:hypothetical protein
MATDDIEKLTTRSVCQQLRGSDHLPILPEINKPVPSTQPNLAPSWNFKKANWTLYKQLVEQNCLDLESHLTYNLNNIVKVLTDIILDSAKKSIPRGTRVNYKPYWSDDLDKLHNELTRAHDQMVSNPSTENIKLHNDNNDAFNREKNISSQRAWHDKPVT